MCNGANEVDKVTGDMREKKQKREKEGMELRLVSYDELPEYMKENEFILDHYRSEWPLKYAFLSLFRWHNETLNVWTHLIGFFVFLWLTVVNLRHVPDVADLLNNFSW
uniref:Uncharacterized protein C30D11.11 n=1 Tax=Anthurium amnicola TaxID=1678845 RepID=A0A1D1ZFV7_9ARAE